MPKEGYYEQEQIHASYLSKRGRIGDLLLDWAPEEIGVEAGHNFLLTTREEKGIF